MPAHFPEAIKNKIEQLFLYPLEQPEIWNKLFSHHQYQKNLIDNIEHLANQGILNLQQLEKQCTDLTKPQDYNFFMSCWSYFQPVICLNPQAPNWLDFPANEDATANHQNVSELIEHCRTTVSQQFPDLKPQTWRECVGLCLLVHHPEPTQQLWQNPSEIKDWLVGFIRDQNTFCQIIFPDNALDQAWNWLVENPELSKPLLEAIQYYFIGYRLHLSLGSKKQFGFLQRLLDQQTSNVLYSIPYQKANYLLRGNNTLSAGTANIKSVHISENFEFSFSTIHGSFDNPTINDHAAFCAASVFYEHIVDIFTLPILKNAKFELEEQIENHFFMQNVADHLQFFSPKFQIPEILPALERATQDERQRFLLATPRITHTEQTTILNNIQAAGQPIATKAPELMFRHCRFITLEPEEILIQEGSPAAFAYVAFEEGLKGYSSRGQIEFYPKPWIMLGHIAIIQGGTRTATIKTTKQLKLLMIHAEIYLYFWHITHSEKDFLEILP